MIGVLGHDSALLRLHCAEDNLGDEMKFVMNTSQFKYILSFVQGSRMTIVLNIYQNCWEYNSYILDIQMK